MPSDDGVAVVIREVFEKSIIERIAGSQRLQEVGQVPAIWRCCTPRGNMQSRERFTLEIDDPTLQGCIVSGKLERQVTGWLRDRTPSESEAIGFDNNMTSSQRIRVDRVC